MRNPLSAARFTLACIPILLTACGGGGGGGSNWPMLFPTPTPTQTPPAPAPVASAQEKCNVFAGASLAGATLKEATLVPAATGSAEYCKVTGSLHGTLNFEVHLPTVWNNKLLYAGGGGWDGSISITPLSPSGSTAGYVLVASDGGRQGDGLDASVFLNNPTAQADFGYLSIHSVNEVTKEIVRKRYGSDAEFSYFEGCSNGGREALIQATRFPNDFDGIVVRAPAYSFTELFQAFVANGKALAAPGGQLNDAKVSLIGKSVTAQCDALDGVADGMVSNQEACTFNPAVLRCTAGDADTCLTDPQIATANTIYSELKRKDGTTVYPGWGPGGEDQGWPLWVTGSAIGGTGLQFMFGSGLVKYWVTGDPAFNVLGFDPELYAPGLRLAATTLDATPDLRSFFGQGGKMILAHGTNDWAISYKGSIKYFNDVATTVGGASTRDASMEFFLQPGVQHCAGGVGPDTVDLVDAVAKWREGGTKPSTQNIVATKMDLTTKAPVLTRPLCKYPSFPKYKGSGDVNSADSYTCQNS
ncbi:feruloyl esterase [Variovorax sp. YR750]|uniref:tannase/feruloyl esterase family alpha/beta hydrolase n=1 Tax=Variovorax sp. YR750 TaxID=1884384 RepID=UPI0008B5BC69|nr:tannase/feruloyl esterase family alpha/beta hydrolase [Variovorax sp. YR750]SEM06276.1 feruloyl esterase [Variovorax sp. YR750]